MEAFCPFIPMFAATGVPDLTRVADYFDHFCDVGIRQVMLYPRSGCELAYMETPWLDFVTACVRLAKDRKMKIWLYDEFNWPSGSCNGMVTRLHPEYTAKRIEVKGGKACVSTMEEPVGRTVFLTDLFNPDAVRCFIDLTHERYAQTLREEFGNTIVGIFTDEPSFIYSSLYTTFQSYPYYDGLAEDYATASGRELLQDAAGGTLTSDFERLLSDRFRTVFLQQVADWCHIHNLRLCGHFLSDDNISGGVHATGDLLAAMETLDIPGIDEIWTTPRPELPVLFGHLEYASRHRNAGMAELFACGPCSMGFTIRRNWVWYAACHGADHIFLAITHLQAHGNRKKPGFFHNFSPANPDFDGMKLLCETGIQAAVYARKPWCAAVAVELPDWETAVSAKRGNSVPDKALEQLTNALNDAQIQWRFVRHGENCPEPVIHTLEEALEVSTPRLLVTDGQERLMSGLLVRSYEDGSFVVLDCTGQRPPNFTVHICGRRYVLPSWGVITDQTVPNACRILTAANYSTDLSFSSLNLLRAPLFPDGTWTFCCRTEAEVVFCIESRAENVLLDGKVLQASLPCCCLTDCFNAFYRSTVPVRLLPGTHILSANGTDMPHIPLVILSGNFTFKEDTILPRETAASTDDPLHFFGTVTRSFSLPVPNSDQPLKLELQDAAGYITCRMDGADLPPQIAAPYRFPIPRHRNGQVISVELTFYSSLAPIFSERPGIEYAPGLKCSKPLCPETASVSAVQVVCENNMVDN